MARQRNDVTTPQRLHDGPGRPVGKSSDVTRDALLAAGLQTFAEVGYEAASTRLILERAGVTAPALYHHFGNKAGLYAAIATEVNDELGRELVAAANAADGDLADKLIALFRRAGDLAKENRALVRFLMTAPLDLRRHEELRGTARDMNRIIGLISELCEAHAPEGVDVAVATRAGHVLLFGLTRITATRGDDDVRATIDAMAAMLEGAPFRT